MYRNRKEVANTTWAANFNLFFTNHTHCAEYVNSDQEVTQNNKLSPYLSVTYENRTCTSSEAWRELFKTTLTKFMEML